MDLDSQEQLLRLSETHGPDDLVVVIGAPDPESAAVTAETVVRGDPSYAGALAGVQLGLEVRHVLDDEIRQAVPDDVWDAQIGVMADVLDGAALSAAVAEASQGDGASG